MGLDNFEFRIGQLSGLPQQFIGQLQLADIIIEAAEDQCIFLILRHGQPVSKSSGQKSGIQPLGIGNLVFAGHQIV